VRLGKQRSVDHGANKSSGCYPMFTWTELTQDGYDSVMITNHRTGNEHVVFNYEQVEEIQWHSGVDVRERALIARVEAAGNKITTNYGGGIVYYGQMKGCQRHGCGTYTFASGSKYVGEFKNGKYNGNGTYTWADGNKYVGEFKNDKQHGNGNFTWASGDKYVGQYKNDLKHGQGTHTLTSGTIYHSGKWVNGSPKK